MFVLQWWTFPLEKYTVGSWGYGSFDNDESMDLKDKFESLSENEKLEIILSTLSKNEPENSYLVNEQRAAAMIVFENYSKNQDLVNKAIKTIKNILKNKDWIESWKDPYRIEKSVKEDLLKLRKIT